MCLLWIRWPGAVSLSEGGEFKPRSLNGRAVGGNCQEKSGGEGVPGRGKSKCKGPGVGLCCKGQGTVHEGQGQGQMRESLPVSVKSVTSF